MSSKQSNKPANIAIVSRMVPPPTEFIVGKRNPIRHYRKQLTGTNTANLLIQHVFDIPGDSIIQSKTDDCPKCNTDNPLFFSEEIYPNKTTNVNNLNYCCNNAINSIIRTANTNVRREYSTSNREFLKNRCKNFKSNLYSNISNCSRDCSNCLIGDVSINGNNDKITSTGNINNSIGGTSMSAFIYKRGFRDIRENSINNNNDGLCCPETPGIVLHKNNNNVCRVNNYPNLSRHAILCRRL